ncbi:hypothetical protein SCA6_005848 [Theobroma cacao]
MRVSGELKRRRRPAPHSGTNWSEFTGTTHINKGAFPEQLPTANDDEPDLIRLETVNYDELDLVHQESHLLEIANGVLSEQKQLPDNQDGWRLKKVGEANADSENDLKQTTLETDHVERDLGSQNIQVSNGDEENGGSNNHDVSSLKDVLTWVFPITNFTLELPSAVFDQLSSKDHPHYALIMMLISFIALMACIAELFYKGGNRGGKPDGGSAADFVQVRVVP